MSAADFPDYMSMLLMSNPDRYKVSMWCGMQDRWGNLLYENDFVRHKDNLYQVVFTPPEFTLECVVGQELGELMYEDDLEYAGNIYDNPELIANYQQSLN